MAFALVNGMPVAVKMGRSTCPGRPRLAKLTSRRPPALMAKFLWAFLNSSRKPFSKMLTSLILCASHWLPRAIAVIANLDRSLPAQVPLNAHGPGRSVGLANVVGHARDRAALEGQFRQVDDLVVLRRGCR